MATLTIRNVEDEVRDYFRAKAAQHGRSMEAEIREALQHLARRRLVKPGDVFRRINAEFAALGGVDELKLPEDEPLQAPVSFDE